jgi:hypothetical protein
MSFWRTKMGCFPVVSICPVCPFRLACGARRVRPARTLRGACPFYPLCVRCPFRVVCRVRPMHGYAYVYALVCMFMHASRSRVAVPSVGYAGYVRLGRAYGLCMP